MKTEQFLREGSTARQLSHAVVGGSLVRVRKGWYAFPGLDPTIEQAFRVGGVLACATAAVSHGLWVPRFSGLHVSVPANASRLRDRERHDLRLPDGGNTVVHWSKDAPRPCALIRDVEDCIVEAAFCRGA